MARHWFEQSTREPPQRLGLSRVAAGRPAGRRGGVARAPASCALLAGRTQSGGAAGFALCRAASGRGSWPCAGGERLAVLAALQACPASEAGLRDGALVGAIGGLLARAPHRLWRQ